MSLRSASITIRSTFMGWRAPAPPESGAASGLSLAASSAASGLSSQHGVAPAAASATAVRTGDTRAAGAARCASHPATQSAISHADSKVIEIRAETMATSGRGNCVQNDYRIIESSPLPLKRILGRIRPRVAAAVSSDFLTVPPVENATSSVSPAAWKLAVPVTV